jgi:Spy/CpxP family protein refolding chaperone
MMGSAKKWMGVTLAATLLIGVGAGVLADRFLLAPTTVHSRKPDVGRGGDSQHREHGERMVERLRSGLELTEEQAAQLEKVMNDNHETARQFWGDSRQEYEALRRQFRADIRGILSDEQQVKFDEMVAEYETRNHNEREGRRGGR